MKVRDTLLDATIHDITLQDAKLSDAALSDTRHVAAVGGRPIKVAAVLDTWIVSGPGRQLAALALALAPLGVEVRIVMFQREGRPPSPYIAYLREQGLEPVVLRERGPGDLGALRGLAQALRDFAPDIVQSHGYRPTGLVSLLRLGRPAWRWIGFFHGATRQDLKDRIYNRLNLTMLRRAQRLVVLSEEHRHWFAGMGSRVRLIHNACLTLPPPAEPQDFSQLQEPGRSLIGVAARLSHEKGVDILIEALGALRRNGLDATLAIAGDGPEQESLRRQAQRLGLEPHVRFLGRISDVAALYRVIDVLAIPSRDGAEGLPNVLLEAMAANLPVVAAGVAAIPEVLDDPRAGRVVRPGDVASLAAALETLLVTRGDTAAQSEAASARQAVVKRFSLGMRAALHRSLYLELLDG